jgi:AbrB family looped-hinge helix DNA binding protein
VTVVESRKVILSEVRVMTWKKLVSVQEKGQVTLPVEVRRQFGLKEGDLVAASATSEGVLITPQEAVATKALDALGAMLREQGLSLHELIDSGREIRGELITERYGISSTDRPA